MHARIVSGFIAAAVLAMAVPALAQQAPTPEFVAERLTVDQDGASVTVAQGASVAIELQTRGSGGYYWNLASKPDFLSEPMVMTGPTVAPTPGARPRLGAPTWQVFVFEATGEGSGEIVIELRGPGGGAVAQTFRATITTPAQ